MTGVIILAAGQSRRLGKPKQKILYKGKTLLQRAIETAMHSACEPIIVVLGAYVEEIKDDIKDKKIIICYNAKWKEGIASSIRMGITMLQKTAPTVSDVILMVSDQPFINAELLNSLITKKTLTGKEIIACSYNSTLGVPVLFDKRFFQELLLLEGDEGAKKILIKHKDSVAVVGFPLAETDIDTIQDYKALMESENKSSKKL